MKSITIVLFATLLSLIFTPAGADEYSAEAYNAGDDLFTTEELDDLLAPIALYPDPLIAQILPAATFVDQIDEAARYVRQYGKSARIDLQPWDVSVKAVAHYPTVLFMMDNRYEWTVSLGQAFVNQEQEVMDIIQQLRADAKAAGSLISTPQQQVIVEGQVIRIIPAEAEVIYVPQYDPVAVYVEGFYPSYGFISFGIGFGIGAWLNRDCDWHRHRIFYHGWRGRGWINRARPFINTRNRTYINSRHRDIHINRRVVQHDTIRFRNELRRNVELRREQGRRPGAPANVPQRRTRVAPPATTVPRPASPGTIERRSPDRGRLSQGEVSKPYSGFGGYGSDRELKTYRQRGRMSRDSVHQLNRQPLTTGQPSAVPGIGTTRSAPAPTIRQAPPAPAPSTRSAPQIPGGVPGGSRPARQR
ncbi:protein of unknown function, DUF330-containing [Geotalea daltonii FRC-32]|uniref:DUF3300 domain-containing protein n=1 Tax=Geotalea daltonii (strain DSM 22248 / JCM 15807 / FRC-32) TaxID=316067 RepID=B9M4L3_GEODF|nr:DUF3300 domain-containing protein [Geotalea daltonii]ACM19739.1 protein of unknown function, DUF330-containing [Geotalea daltonii FRC-32]